MKVIKYPKRQEWPSLCRRPLMKQEHLRPLVKAVLEQVKEEGDKALRELTARFDGVELVGLEVSPEEIWEAEGEVSAELKEAIQLAKGNIEAFHASQKEEVRKVETSPGVVCWRRSVPVERVGLYIPGGTAPLFSTLLMLGIPAKLAGCKEIILSTPPGKNGKIAAEILYAASLIGVDRIVKAGGAQAVAAMAYGTETVSKVDKIFGPGNQYVTMAKMLVQEEGVAIDMPAGPSEVLVIADDSCPPSFAAADLLSQAEHGSDSQVVMVTTSGEYLEKVLEEVEKQVKQLSREQIARAALENSKAILVNDLQEAVSLSNVYAPEHLIIAVGDAEQISQGITQAGSVFLGPYSCESAGDYCSGTNHTLPTNGFARAYSGVSLDSFVRKITFQHLSRKGLENIGPAIEVMAEAEGLQGHAEAVRVRVNGTRPTANGQRNTEHGTRGI
jgi:histidinol dehydrogenase